MGELLGCGGDAEEGRIGAYLDGLAVGHELKDAQPTVASVAFPATSERLHVEHHLVNVLAGGVTVAAVCHGIVEFAHIAGVSAEHKAYVGRVIDEFVPDVLPVVGGLYGVGLVGSALCRALLQERMSDEDDTVGSVLLACAELFSPFQHLGARCPFGGNDEDFAPGGFVEFVFGILQLVLSLAVG